LFAGRYTYTKSLNDSLVWAGVLVNDNRQYAGIAPVTFSRDSQAWGTVIRLEDL
jgi:hypothetical protein